MMTTQQKHAGGKAGEWDVSEPGQAMLSNERLDLGTSGDPELEEAIGNFRLHVMAWSDAALSRQRFEIALARRRTWQNLAAWSVSCALAVAMVGGGLYERQHRQELARIAAARQAEEQRQLAEERVRESEDLLARVDSEISRQVPSALEPLARLMAEDESQ